MSAAAGDRAAALPPPEFDCDPDLAELVPSRDRARLAAALAALLGGPARLASTTGEVVAGDPAAALAARTPVRYDLEPLGYLEAQTAERLPAVAALLEMLLQHSGRYLMAARVHLRAVQADYEELQRRHAQLQDSEARYRDLSEHLEQRVAEQVRTIETAQRQLYQAEKLASVGQLAAGVAHEINNPLGFICSNLRTARSYVAKIASCARAAGAGGEALARSWREEGLDAVVEDFPELLAESLAGAERVAAIVRDLKGFSNIDHNEEEVADLNDCLRTVCNVARAQIGAGATLALEAGALPRTRCRPGHLAQVFLNLLLNAGSAVGAGGTITVRSSCDGQRICVSVADDGCGIPPEALHRVFDPFFTTREVGQGTGLGLTVSRDIVRAHGGELTVASAVGRGTTATACLPVVA